MIQKMSLYPQDSCLGDLFLYNYKYINKKNDKYIDISLDLKYNKIEKDKQKRYLL